MKIKNTGTTSMDVTVIKEVVTTLAAGVEKDVDVDPATDRIEIGPTPTP